MVGKNLPALHEAQVTKCRILQRDMSVPIEQQNDEIALRRQLHSA